MTHDDIIRMAREAGGGLSCIAEPLEHPWKFSESELVRFAALVAAAERDLLKETQDALTLRDYFAAKAPEEDIKRYLFTGRIVEVVVKRIDGRKEIDKQPEIQTREQARYAFADAMLKVRGKE